MNLKKAIYGIAISALTLTTSLAGEFGEYNAGDTFSLKVTAKETSRIFTSGRIVRNVPVPKGIASFKRGQTVNFRIGAKGQLKAKGMSIPFAKSMSTPGYATAYFSQTRKSADSATIHKLTGSETDFAQITFVRNTGTGSNAGVVTVSYALEKKP